MSQLVSIRSSKKIYKSDTPTVLIEPGDRVNVGIRSACGCGTGSATPGVPTAAQGCDPNAQRESESAHILANQIPPAKPPLMTATLVSESVDSDGKGFTFDRTLPGQDFRSSDIELIMPDHDVVACGDSGSV